MMRRRGIPRAPRRLGVLELPVLQEFRPGEPGDASPARDADDDHDVEDAPLLDERRERQDQEERRKADHHLDEPADDSVHETAEVAARAPSATPMAT